MTQRCTGSIDFYGEKFHCWKKKGHGFMDMREGLKQSCDVYFYEVARKLGIDRLSETARKFGANSAKRKNYHPTVKPIILMEYLVRLVTPKEGIVLEPFAGSGTTIAAALEQGREGEGIELNRSFKETIERRLA